jgi:ribosomal protein S21
MPVRIEVGPDETLAHALARLRRAVDLEYGRTWTRRRYGYYERPAILRRKRQKMRYRKARGGSPLWLRVGMREQWRRTGPNAMGR